jgi:hypothetical protein
LKFFYSAKYNIVIKKKHQIYNMETEIQNQQYEQYEQYEQYQKDGALQESEESQRNLAYRCDIISYTSGSESGSGSDCYIEEEEYEFKKPEPNIPFDYNDPLRYFMEIGEMTPNEYKKWKIVNEKNYHSQMKKRPDYGPGYNSDSDCDTESYTNDEDNYIVYGNGYIPFYENDDTEHYDVWNPNPDPTPSYDQRFAKVAKNNTRFRMSRLVTHDEYQIPQLTKSFELKLIWERFMIKSSEYFHPLQTFWQENALTIYESLQDLVEDHARCFNSYVFTADVPRYHTTPIEVLENTFETIGRMSRCIAEDFNTHQVIQYVDEFIVSLYNEIEFVALLELYMETTTQGKQ